MEYLIVEHRVHRETAGRRTEGLTEKERGARSSFSSDCRTRLDVPFGCPA